MSLVGQHVRAVGGLPSEATTGDYSRQVGTSKVYVPPSRDCATCWTSGLCLNLVSPKDRLVSTKSARVRRFARGNNVNCRQTVLPRRSPSKHSWGFAYCNSPSRRHRRRPHSTKGLILSRDKRHGGERELSDRLSGRAQGRVFGP